MPSNRLELWALMSAGTLAHPVFREFYKERDVVYEERRMRTESSPVGRLIDEFIHASYVAHPYGFGGIGHPSDLKSFSRTQGEEFFRSHYVAKNMVDRGGRRRDGGRCEAARREVLHRPSRTRPSRRRSTPSSRRSMRSAA